MTRIQILELPEGAGDERPPFIVVFDQLDAMNTTTATAVFDQAVKAWGAQGTLVTTDTIEIPANEVPLGVDGLPVRVQVEPLLDGFRDQVAAAIVEARAQADRAAKGGA